MTECKKKFTDNKEKPSIVYHRTLMVVLFFTFKKVGEWPTFELMFNYC